MMTLSEAIEILKKSRDLAYSVGMEGANEFSVASTRSEWIEYVVAVNTVCSFVDEVVAILI